MIPYAAVLGMGMFCLEMQVMILIYLQSVMVIQPLIILMMVLAAMMY